VVGGGAWRRPRRVRNESPRQSSITQRSDAVRMVVLGREQALRA
jgi:hypothetical protein